MASRLSHAHCKQADYLVKLAHKVFYAPSRASPVKPSKRILLYAQIIGD
jgi:hypothetical protein